MIELSLGRELRPRLGGADEDQTVHPLRMGPGVGKGQEATPGVPQHRHALEAHGLPDPVHVLNEGVEVDLFGGHGARGATRSPLIVVDGSGELADPVEPRPHVGLVEAGAPVDEEHRRALPEGGVADPGLAHDHESGRIRQGSEGRRLRGPFRGTVGHSVRGVPPAARPEEDGQRGSDQGPRQTDHGWCPVGERHAGGVIEESMAHARTRSCGMGPFGNMGPVAGQSHGTALPIRSNAIFQDMS